MLAVEHIAHGEVILYPPFLTAMQNSADKPIMLQEMATVGGTMTLAIFILWLILVSISQKMKKTQKTIQ